jgi:hypothetical protein
MFIRLVVKVKHPESHRLAGVFDAAYGLLDRGQLDIDEEARLELLLEWFNRLLPIPQRFSRSNRRHARQNAVCWFKEDAGSFITQVRLLASLLDRHGVPTEMLRTDRPGYVVYADQYQVVAVPFRDTGA